MLVDQYRSRSARVSWRVLAMPRTAWWTPSPSRCRARGRTHISRPRLAPHRINVLFAMLRDGMFYEPSTPTPHLTKDTEAPLCFSGAP
ncbi:hypothetical protein GR131_27425 [Streptomyces sp. GF20]|nr:hypothetical protein GR131_27425 [Streptomyces sp. GF20]